MAFKAHSYWMHNFIIAEEIEHLSPVTTVYDTQISQKLEIEYEPRRKTPVFGVPDQVRHKPRCPATGNGKVPGISNL